MLNFIIFRSTFETTFICVSIHLVTVIWSLLITDLVDSCHHKIQKNRCKSLFFLLLFDFRSAKQLCEFSFRWIFFIPAFSSSIENNFRTFTYFFCSCLCYSLANVDVFRWNAFVVVSLLNKNMTNLRVISPLEAAIAAKHYQKKRRTSERKRNRYKWKMWSPNGRKTESATRKICWSFVHFYLFLFLQLFRLCALFSLLFFALRIFAFHHF